MRIQFASDLHIDEMETKTSQELLKDVQADAILLCGDIGKGMNGLEYAQSLSDRMAAPVLYILGNYEYYGEDACIHGAVCHTYANQLGLQRRGCVYMLENEYMDIDHVRFFGLTLWTDFALHKDCFTGGVDRAMHECALSLQDFTQIRFGSRLFHPRDARYLNKKSIEWLNESLEEPWDGERVVVSHFPPLPQLENPEFEQSMISGAFASDLTDHIHWNRITHWIYGHTHANINGVFREVRFMTNQLGSPGETCRTSFSAIRHFII
jgi:predicted phosphodiesterase